MTVKKLSLVIDDNIRRKNFIQAIKKYFKNEMSAETFKVAIQECDIIEFSFKGNGYTRIRKTDLLVDE